MPELRFSRQRIADAVVIDIVGEIDISNVELFENEIREASESAGTIVVSFEHASYVDSATVNTLIRAVNLLREKGKRLVVAAPSDNRCNRIFHLIGIDQLVPVKRSVGEAVAAS